MAASSSALPARLASSLQLAHRLNPRLNAFTHLASQSELEEQYAQARKLGKGKGKLNGTAVAVKDMFATTGNGSRTTCASRMLRDYESPFEATVVEKLRREGALVVGKTNMDEFGMGSANVNSHFGPTLNPAGPQGVESTLALSESEQRVAGGSSGGSAAAVAAGVCDLALATDTGGSTRLPAAYCGIVGFKPSYGLLSRHGVVAYASSLDTVGLMGRQVRHVEEAFHVLDEHDERDPTSAPTYARDRAKTLHNGLADRLKDSSPSRGKPLAGIRIGVPADLFPTSLLSPSLLPSLRSTISLLRSLGATLSSVRLESAPAGLSAYYVLASAEASSNLARYDGIQFGFRAPDDLPDEPRTPLYAKTRSLGFGDEVKKRILLGTFALSAEAFDNYYLQAQRVRRMIQLELDSLFSTPNPLEPPPSSPASARPSPEAVDFLIHPTTICPAPLVSSFTTDAASGPRPCAATAASSYVQDLLSLPASLAGLPAISLPVGKTAPSTPTDSKGPDADPVPDEAGWPVGMTFVGQWGNDRNVLELARVVELALIEEPR
ncbi:hypothetical protein JCM10212_004261 [Sporobolomyces blumeae]